MGKIVFEVRDLSDNQLYIWGIEEMLAEVNQNTDSLGDYKEYTEKDWFDGWVEGDTYNLLRVNGKIKFGTVACKDSVEFILIQMFSNIGIDIPKNYEDIVQYCYEDIMNTAEDLNWHSGDVAIAFRRWIESKTN